MVAEASINAHVAQLIYEARTKAGLTENCSRPESTGRNPSQQQIQGIAAAVGRKEAEVVREAIALYLAKTNSVAVKGAIANLQDRVATLPACQRNFLYN